MEKLEETSSTTKKIVDLIKSGQIEEALCFAEDRGGLVFKNYIELMVANGQDISDGSKIKSLSLKLDKASNSIKNRIIDKKNEDENSTNSLVSPLKDMEEVAKSRAEVLNAYIKEIEEQRKALSKKEKELKEQRKKEEDKQKRIKIEEKIAELKARKKQLAQDKKEVEKLRRQNKARVYDDDENYLKDKEAISKLLAKKRNINKGVGLSKNR